MPFVEKRLSGPTQLTTAAQVLYTVPSGGQSAVIRQLVVTNISASAATFTFYVGTESASNALFSNSSVAANDTVIINLSQVLATNEVVRAKASVNSALNLTMSGVENDGPLAQGATYIPDGAITASKIANASITSAKIVDNAVDTLEIANNAVTQAKLSSNLSGITVTTSASRATAVPSPFEGQMIYETDTDMLAIWNGSAWRYLSSAVPTVDATRGGTVLQTVIGTTSTLVTNNSSTYIDTGLTATITPKSTSSKILVLVSHPNCWKSAANAGNGLLMQIHRNGSNILQNVIYTGFTNTAMQMYFCVSSNYLDIPSSTSALTYKTVFCNNANGDGVVVQQSNILSQITLMEIAG